MWLGIGVILFGIALLGGGLFIFNLAQQTPSGVNEWWQPFAIAGETAGNITGAVMFWIGVISIPMGGLILYFQDYRK